MMCGGFGQDHPSTPEIEGLVQQVHSQVTQKLGHEPGAIKVISYQTQVVAGTNYMVKAEIEGHVYYIKIYQELPCNGGQVNLTEFSKDN